jgi:hypothetical protein
MRASRVVHRAGERGRDSPPPGDRRSSKFSGGSGTRSARRCGGTTARSSRCSTNPSARPIDRTGPHPTLPYGRRGEPTAGGAYTRWLTSAQRLARALQDDPTAALSCRRRDPRSRRAGDPRLGPRAAAARRINEGIALERSAPAHQPEPRLVRVVDTDEPSTIPQLEAGTSCPTCCVSCGGAAAARLEAQPCGAPPSSRPLDMLRHAAGRPAYASSRTCRDGRRTPPPIRPP